MNGAVRTRPGHTMTSDGSLPAGEVQVLQQVRFPSSEQKYLVAQVKGEYTGWLQSSQDASAPSVISAVCWDESRGVLWCMGDTGTNHIAYWTYDTDTWTETASYVPAEGWIGYDPVNDQIAMIVDGGHVAFFDCETGTWGTTEATSGTGPTTIAGALYIPSLRQFVVLETADIVMWKNVYILDINTKIWTKYTPTLPASHGESGTGPSMVYFADTNSVAVLGGHSGELGQRPYLWLLDLTSNTWTAGTNYPVGTGFSGVAVGCNNMLYAYDNLANPSQGASYYDLGSDTWTTIAAPDDPSSRDFTYMLITDDDNVVIVDAPHMSYGYRIWFFSGYGLDCSPMGTFNSLYASPDDLPIEAAAFTKIADLSPDAEPVSIAVLNDRAVIANIKDYPLVFGGGMDETGADWMFPIHVLSVADGIHGDDVSSWVCDPDPTTAADMGNIGTQGFIDICCDVREVTGFYFGMKTPNAGVSGTASAFAAVADYLDDDYAARLNLIGGITTFIRDGVATGHFNTANSLVTVGTLLVFDDGTTATIISKTSDGTHASDIGIDADHISGTLTAIYGISVDAAADKVGPHFGSTSLTPVFDKAPVSIVNLPKTSIRQVINHTELTGDGNGRVRLIFRAGQQPFKLDYCSIVQQDTVANGNAAPTQVTFNGGQSGIQAGAEIAANNLKGTTNYYTQDSGVAGHFNALGPSIAAGQMIVFVDNSIAIIVSMTAPGTGASEVILDRSHVSAAVIGVYPAIISDPVTFTEDHTKTYIVSMYIVGVSVTTQVPTGGWNAGPTPTTYTTITQEVGGLASSAGSGYYSKIYDGTLIGACYNQQTVFGFSDLVPGVCVGVVEIQADTVHPLPTLLQISHSTSMNQVSLSFATSMDSIQITQETPGNSKIYHAFSFDGRQSFNIWKSGAWYGIVRLNGSTWQHKNAVPAWSNATANSLEQALADAFGITGNRVEKAAYEALVTADWMSTGGLNVAVAATLDFAQGFLCDGQNLPQLTGYTVGYSGQSVIRVDGRKAGAWQEITAVDNTAIDGVSLAQSGIMTFPEFDADYDTVDGVPGFHYRIWTNGTSADCAIAQIKYKARCQALQNIGNGQPGTVVGAVYYDTSEEQPNDIAVILSDYVETNLSSTVIPMDTTDYLYFGYLTRFNGLIITPLTDSENQTSSVMVLEYWNGLSWTALPINDGTSVDGKTLHAQGAVNWSLPSDWGTCIPITADYPRAYWIRLSVTSTLTSTTALVEVRVNPVPGPIQKHRLAEVMGNRVALAGTPAEPDRVDVSQEFKEYGFNGPDSGSWRVGGMDSAVAMIGAWNSLYVAKTDSWHTLNGNAFNNVEASRHTPINQRVLVKAPAPGDQAGALNALYFLNGYGAWMAGGLQADNAYNSARVICLSDAVRWWDQDNIPRIHIPALYKAAGVYWPERNCIVWTVPMIVDDQEVEQLTCNRLIIHDLSLHCWYTPWTISAASLCTAYHYNANAPGKLGALGLYAGNYSGQVLRLMDGATDLGVAIAAWMETGWLNMSFSEAEKQIRRMRLYGLSSTDVTLKVKVDGESDVRPGYSKTIPGLTGLTGKFLGPDKDVKKYFSGNFYKIGLEFAGETELYGIEIEGPPIREELLRR